MTVFLATIRPKQKLVNEGWCEDHTNLFLVREDINRKAFTDFIKKHNEDLDLRTVRWEEFDNSGRLIDLKAPIVAIESQLGSVVLL